ncbi:hypothetical protein BDY24DRAFT_63565 [Mrakia frigida]|uniref:uncharacterized protein n=1 Tax=Mrakia frigida TaxID=29902 RepID=UPI003FCC0FCD
MDVDHDSSSSSSSSQPSPLRADSPMDEDKAPSKEEEESRSSMDEDESFSEEEKEPSSDQEEDEHPSSDAVQHGPSPISSYHPSTPTVPLSHETIDPSCPVLQPSHEIPAFTLPLPLQPPSTSSSSSLPPPPPPQTGNVFDSKSPPKPKEILDWFLRNLSSNHPDIVRRILVYVADGEGEKERRRKIEAVPGLIKEGWEVYDWMVKEYKKYFALYPDRFKGTMSYAPPNLDRDRDLPPPLSPRVDIWNYACKKENLSTSNEWHDENMKSVPTIQIMSKSTAWIASKEKKSWTFDICPQAFDSSAAAGAAKQQPRYDRDKAFYPPNTIPGLVNVATTVIAFILRTNVPTIITTHGVYWPRFFQNLTSSIGVPYLPNSLSIPTPSTYAHQLSLGSDLLLPSALAGSDLNIILQHLPHAGDLSFGGRNGSFERRITGAVQLDAGTTLVGALSGVSVKTEDEWRYISKRGTKYTGVLLDRRVLRKRWLAEGLSEEVVKQKDEDYWEGLGSFEGKDVLNATFLSDCEKSKKQWLKKQGKKLESGEETEARRLAKEAKEAKKKKETEERRLAKEAKEAKEKEERRLAKEAKEKDLWIAGLEASTTTTSRSVPLPSGHGLVQPLSALPQAQQPPATTTTSLLHLPIPPSLNFYHHLPPRPLPRLPLHQASLVPDSNPFLLTPNLTQAHGDAFLLPSSNSTAPPSSHQPLPNSSSPPPRPPPPPASVLPPLLPAVACENCEDTISDGVGKRGSGGKTLCDPCGEWASTFVELDGTSADPRSLLTSLALLSKQRKRSTSSS